MKLENENNSDRLLSSALREWEVKDPLPLRFGEQVWKRIAREEAQGTDTVSLWVLVAEKIMRPLSRPALAFSYVSLLLLLGLVSGYLHGQSDKARENLALSTRYVQLMDPYQLRH